RRRDQQAWKIYARDDLSIRYDAVAAAQNCVGDKCPDQESGVSKDWVRHAIRWNLDQLTEKDREDYSDHDRLQDNPCGADNSLFVTHFKVTPNQEVKHFAVRPKLGEIKRLPKTRRPDFSHRFCREMLEWGLERRRGNPDRQLRRHRVCLVH